jgi:hypothetical protein
MLDCETFGPETSMLPPLLQLTDEGRLAFETPVNRHVERIEQPSTRAEITAERVLESSRFIHIEYYSSFSIATKK